MNKKAVIVSNKECYCRQYLRTKHLNPNDYYIATSAHQLSGLAYCCPVIVTHCSGPVDDDVAWMLKHLFHFVSIEDY